MNNYDHTHGIATNCDQCKVKQQLDRAIQLLREPIIEGTPSRAWYEARDALLREIDGDEGTHENARKGTAPNDELHRVIRGVD